VTTFGYAFLGLTAIVAALVGAFMFALLRFSAAARAAQRQSRQQPAETALLSSALQDALTALKAREQAMTARAAASEALSAQVFDSLTAGLLVVDAKGVVKIANPAACQMLGIDSGVTGIPCRDLPGASPIVEIVAEGITSGRAIVRRAVQHDVPDRSRHFGVTVSPLGDPGSGQGVICLFSDLTAVVELEQQLQMKEALARLGEMTAGIAHEFRNGLATIHGYSRLIDPAALPPPYHPYIEGIRQETDALGRIVTSFLNFARPEQMSLCAVDLEAVARRAADDLRVELPAGATVDIGGTFGSTSGDEMLLRQVFGNLIRNAAEACTGAGRTPAITIAARVEREAGTASVTVEDNGPGIQAADRARIFQPFFTTRSRGSGLGLAIVQKIVLLHNGRISVGAAATGGAQFQLVFPLA
jgi:signal transduction histidine kinase